MIEEREIEQAMAETLQPGEIYKLVGFSRNLYREPYNRPYAAALGQDVETLPITAEFMVIKAVYISPNLWVQLMICGAKEPTIGWLGTNGFQQFRDITEKVSDP